MRTFRILAACLLAATGLFACQLLIGVDDDPGLARLPDAPPPDVADASRPDECVRSSPPEPPNADDGSDLPGMWFALSDLSFSSRTPVGFDLDGVCTGFRGETAFAGGPSCRSDLVTQDLDGGIDNAMSDLLRQIPGGQQNDLLSTVGEVAKRGERAILIYLEQYNGLPDDPYVTAEFAQSARLEANRCNDGGLIARDGGRTVPEAGLAEPAWNGCDQWQLERSPLLDKQSGIPLKLQEGFVSGGVLVVGRKTPVQFEVQVAGLAIPFTNGIAVAKLEPVTSDAGARTFRLRGSLAGRIRPRVLIDAVLNFGVCDEDEVARPLLANIVRDTVCRARDVSDLPVRDRTDTPCVSVSGAAAFVAEPVRAGTLVDAGAPPALCDASFFDASCPNL